MQLLKFGAFALSNGKALDTSLEVIKKKIDFGQKLFIMVSPRDHATSRLIKIIEDARDGKSYLDEWHQFIEYEQKPLSDPLIIEDISQYEQMLEGISLLGDYTQSMFCKFLTLGEKLTLHTISSLLQDVGIKTKTYVGSSYVDIITINDKKSIDFDSTALKMQPIIQEFADDTISIISNTLPFLDNLNYNFDIEPIYTGSILANILNVKEIVYYTNRDGINSVNIPVIPNTKVIHELSFGDAHEIASFGCDLLHRKSIIPLATKQIPLRLKNIFKLGQPGTYISSKESEKSVKALVLKTGATLITAEFYGLIGTPGVNGRVFSRLGENNVNVELMTQGSSEKCLSIVVSKGQEDLAIELLEREFIYENQYAKELTIQKLEGFAILSIIGQNLFHFSGSVQTMLKNNIYIKLINNTANGRNMSIMVREKDAIKAANIFHSALFEIPTRVNIALVGKHEINDAIVNKIKGNNDNKNIDLHIFCQFKSDEIVFHSGVEEKRVDLPLVDTGLDFSSILKEYADKHNLENLILVDSSKDSQLVSDYSNFIKYGFNIISSNNNIFETDQNDIKSTLDIAKKHDKAFNFDSLLGPGLPLINTIKSFQQASFKVTKIRAILPSVFQTALIEYFDFKKSVKKIAKKYRNNQDKFDLGFVNYLHRKMLAPLFLLTLEFDIAMHWDDVVFNHILDENTLNGITTLTEFETKLQVILDNIKRKKTQYNTVRYISTLEFSKNQTSATLKNNIQLVSKTDPLMSKDSNLSIFQIFTEHHQNAPITIIGPTSSGDMKIHSIYAGILDVIDTI